jgi:hypothetical protein
LLSVVRRLRSPSPTGGALLRKGEWEGVAFPDELERLEHRLSLAVVHVLERPPADWQGETGYVTAEGAIRAGQLTMSGPRTLQRGFGRWFTWSAFAPASRSAQKRRTAASRLASPDRVRIAEALYGGARSAG